MLRNFHPASKEAKTPPDPIDILWIVVVSPNPGGVDLGVIACQEFQGTAARAPLP